MTISPAARERERLRRQRRPVRAATLGNRPTKRERDLARAHRAAPSTLPKTRGECIHGPRPCVCVSCEYNLFLDVSPRTGAIKLNFPDLEPEQMQVSCVLDVADRGGTTLDEVGAMMNLTHERVRQIEAKALERLGDCDDAPQLRAYLAASIEAEENRED